MYPRKVLAQYTDRIIQNVVPAKPQTILSEKWKAPQLHLLDRLPY